MNKLCIGLLFALIITGCESVVDNPVVNRQEGPVFQSVFGQPRPVYKEMAHEVNILLQDFHQSTLKHFKPDEWKLADAEVRNFIDEHADHEGSFLIRQTLSQRILFTSPLLKGDITDEDREALQYHVTQLNENEYPDARIIKLALERLGDYVSEEERTKIALSTVEHTYKMLKRNEDGMFRKREKSEIEEKYGVTDQTYIDMEAAAQELLRQYGQ